MAGASRLNRPPEAVRLTGAASILMLLLTALATSNACGQSVIDPTSIQIAQRLEPWIHCGTGAKGHPRKLSIATGR